MHLLKKCGLHVTASRTKIRAVFLQNGQALTQREVRQYCQDKIDRVAVYRTLELLVGNNIIHTLPSGDAVVRYALSNDETNGNGQPGNNLYFICRECGHTFCIKEVSIPDITAPANFYTKEVDVLKAYAVPVVLQT